MSTVAEYRAWLNDLLKQAEKYDDDMELVIVDDNQTPIMDGGCEPILIEEVFYTEVTEDNELLVVVTTDY